MEITRVVSECGEAIYVDGVRVDLAVKTGKVTYSVKTVPPSDTLPQFPERL